MKQVVFSCETCGRFADYKAKVCSCDAPDYRPQGMAEFYTDQHGVYRFRLETFTPEEVK